MEKQFSLISTILIDPLRRLFFHEKLERISKKNHLANSFIYSIDEIVSKDNRLIKSTIEIPIGENKHEQSK